MNLNMSKLDMAFIGLLSLGILLLLLGIIFLVLSIVAGRKLEGLKKKRPKNKKKRKKWQRICRKAEQYKKKRRRNGIFLLIMAVLLGGGASYTRYYQLTNLSTSNAAALAKIYYLIGEIDSQIESYNNGASIEKTEKNIRDLSQQLTSASVETAYMGLSVDGQKKLNRYFTSAKNLGINLNAQARVILENLEQMEMYQSDIEKIKENQQEIFKEYQVNEHALKQKK
ncbi:hypothetical protein IW492_09520 [Enterococcus sp. BWB1-3]|uniref:hypothetical protein n=1 Tax=Enterococcus sp. BWB1-3 TaxID=2787713 RepID=UPI00192054F0|nr:hypothetical protein [Enterococcus sp. BWB1-3]MBL1229469.1 hypothetical protein [Enterococcus sp. BWB1-3]